MTDVQQDKLTNCDWLKAKPLQDVLTALGERSGNARVAGGAVRNALLDEPVNDIDIATVFTPEETSRRAEAAGFSVHPTGIDHGTVTVVVHHDGKAFPFEVTTLRIDAETYGRHAKVAYTQDWKADAARRDFTINALYCDADGKILDPLGGLADITARTIRFVGNAHDRIKEDYLRILRFFRFHARYGRGDPDAAGLAACIELRDGLTQLSPERIRNELFKILVAPGAIQGLELMRDAGVLQLVLPADIDIDCVRLMTVVDAKYGFATDPLLRLAALAGPKPELVALLRLSNAEGTRLGILAANTSLTPRLRDNERRSILYHLNKDAFTDAVRYCWAAGEAAGDDPDWRSLAKLAEDWPVPVFPVTGADIVKRGHEPGPQIGKHLRALEDWWIAAGFPSDKSVVLAQLSKPEV